MRIDSFKIRITSKKFQQQNKFWQKKNISAANKFRQQEISAAGNFGSPDRAFRRRDQHTASARCKAAGCGSRRSKSGSPAKNFSSEINFGRKKKISPAGNFGSPDRVQKAGTNVPLPHVARPLDADRVVLNQDHQQTHCVRYPMYRH